MGECTTLLDVCNLMEMLANLKINLGDGDTPGTTFDENVTASDVDWCQER